jgi:hypothetical protein
VNIDSLHDQELNFKGKSSSFVKVDNRLYETTINKKKSSLTMLLPNKKGKVKAGNF